MSLQMILLTYSNARLCKGFENMDKKLQAIIKSDTRIRALALPNPTIPTVFLSILPVKSLEELDIAEALLAVENVDFLLHKENLVSQMIKN